MSSQSVRRTPGGARAGSGKFTGTHMALVLAAFFAVFFGANMALVYFATGTWTGLVVKNGYVASQRFNAGQAAARRQRKLGWTSTFGHDRGLLEFVLRDRSGQPVSGLTVSAAIGVPTHEQRDHKVLLVEKNTGHYVARDALSAGQWQVDVRGHDSAGRSYRQIFRFSVKAEP